MMVQPRVVISKCIEFDSCRYNSQIIRSDIVKKLQPFVEFIPICPEVEIGLGIPRDPIRIIQKNKQKMLIQPATGNNISEDMMYFAQHFLSTLQNIDGFLLKSQSPSCGTRDVKIYPEVYGSAPIRRDAGFFGEQVLNMFPLLAIEDEMRLTNPFIRDHFFKKIFTFAQFRKVQDSQSFQDLLRFHTENKFLLMAYNQKELKNLGNILANQKKQTLDQVFLEYKNHLDKTFQKAPRSTSVINVLNHSFGYLSKQLTKEEKKFFLDLVTQFRNGQMPVSVPTMLLKSWSIRFNQPYLLSQTFFKPYPEELLDAETLKANNDRNFWKESNKT